MTETSPKKFMLAKVGESILHMMAVLIPLGRRYGMQSMIINKGSLAILVERYYNLQSIHGIRDIFN